MNHNDFREIIDDAPETGADTNTGTAGSRQPGSADNGVPAGNAAHGAQTGVRLPVQKMWRSMRAHQAPER